MKNKIYYITMHFQNDPAITEFLNGLNGGTQEVGGKKIKVGGHAIEHVHYDTTGWTLLISLLVWEKEERKLRS